jgi:hypothetical protein
MLLTRLILPAVALLVSAACSATPVDIWKNDMSHVKQDDYQCTQESRTSYGAGASDPQMFLLLTVIGESRARSQSSQLYKKCMEARGYTVQERESGGSAPVASPAAPVASPAALAPTAARPFYAPGFWFRVKVSNRPQILTYRLTGPEACGAATCLTLAAEGATTVFYTLDLAVVEAHDTTTAAWVRFTPPMRGTTWPLGVGSSWFDSLTIEDSSGRKETGPYKADVVSFETITIPAGSFMAFKIVSSFAGRRFREAWYAPDTRTFVRTIQFDATGRTTATELVDYQKRDEPPP